MNDDQSKVSGNQIDISAVETEDHEKLANLIEQFYKTDASVKQPLSYHWERSHMMLDGKQWITWSQGAGSNTLGGQWVEVKVTKANEFIPRPVTNYMFDCYQTLKSYVIKNKPRITVLPNTQTHKDKSAAKLATLVSETNWERLKEDQNHEYAASVMLTYGTVFKKSYWDTTNLQKVRIPRMQQVPDVDPATGQMIGMKEIQATDPMTGEQLFDELPLGDVNTDVVEPYRLAIDPLATDIHKARWMMEYSIMPLDWVKDVYGKQEEGYTGKAAELKPEPALSGSLRRFYQLKNSSGVKGYMGNSADSNSSPDSAPINSVIVKELYEAPSARHPNGRLIVVANGLCLYAGESPYRGPDQGDWHPYSECRWELVPGRFWGKSPLDNTAEIQKQINSIDSVIILTRKTMAIPQKLIPFGSGVTPGAWSGRPGLEVQYRDQGGAKPETIQPTGVDAQVWKEREQKVTDMKEISGAVDILRGDRPPGVTAASALNMLFEVGTGKIFPVLNRWKQFVENDQKKQLKLIAEKYKEPRPDFIRMLKMKNTELSEEAINAFIGAELYDNCNVTVEAGSNVPKLQSAKQALLLEVAQTGALNLELPANRNEFQRQLGIVGFDNDIGPDVKRAEWENDILDSLPTGIENKAVVLSVDQHEVHLEVHKKRMKEPSFMDLDPQVQQAYMMHNQQHDQYIQMAKQQQMMEAMMTGAPPAEQQQPGAPTPVSGAGKGVSQNIQESLFSDAQTPAGVQG